MPPVAAKSKAKVSTREALCRELLQLRIDNDPVLSRIEAIKTELKVIAEKEGQFRETIVGVGYVSVNPGHSGKFKGDFPTLQIEAWKALTPARQNKLLDGGIVKIEAQYSGAYYGAVTVKLHNEGAST